MKKLLFVITTVALFLASCAKEQLADSTMEEETYGDGVIYKDASKITLPASASPSSGTVSVTDRFGNTYSRTISW